MLILEAKPFAKMQLSNVLAVVLSPLLSLVSTSAIPDLPALLNVGVSTTSGNSSFSSVAGYVKAPSHGPP